MQHDDPHGGAVPDDGPEVDDRSGETVDEAVDVAAAGSASEGVQRPPSEARPGESPVEQTRDDPGMTEAQVLSGPGAAGGPDPAPPSTPPEEASESGGAQSLPGARTSDRTAAQPDEL